MILKDIKYILENILEEATCEACRGTTNGGTCKGCNGLGYISQYTNRQPTKDIFSKIISLINLIEDSEL